MKAVMTRIIGKMSFSRGRIVKSRKLRKNGTRKAIAKMLKIEARRVARRGFRGFEIQ